MSKVFVGVDAGGWKKSGTCECWIARLQGRSFHVSSHVFEVGKTRLPWLSSPKVAAVAVDAPQGLPLLSPPRRCADQEAKTPTKVLPSTRPGLKPGSRQANGKPYPMLSLVAFGCELFWSNRRHLHGLTPRWGRLVETYPRAILLRWKHSGKLIPSKGRTREKYMRFVKRLLSGYKLQGVRNSELRHDHYDAMLCALAAKAHWEGTADYLGVKPSLRKSDGVLREGFIAVPKHSWLHSKP